MIWEMIKIGLLGGLILGGLAIIATSPILVNSVAIIVTLFLCLVFLRT